MSKKKYELEIMIEPRFKILSFEQVEVNFSNTGLSKSTPDYHSLVFYGSTKEVCLNRASTYFRKEMEELGKQLNKHEYMYNKLIGMMYEELGWNNE